MSAVRLPLKLPLRSNGWLTLNPKPDGSAPPGMRFLYDLDGSKMLDLDNTPLYESA